MASVVMDGMAAPTPSIAASRSTSSSEKPSVEITRRS